MGQLRKRGEIWWIRYYRNGKREEESSKSTKKRVAIELLRSREGKIADGVPVTAKINQLRFPEAVADVVTDYHVNGKRSLDDVNRRIDLHLTPFFGGRRMAAISTTDIRVYTGERQEAGAENATINPRVGGPEARLSIGSPSGQALVRAVRPNAPREQRSNGFLRAFGIRGGT